MEGILLALGIVEVNHLNLTEIKGYHTALKNAAIYKKLFWVGMIAGVAELFVMLFVDWMDALPFFLLCLFLSYFVGAGILGLFRVMTAPFQLMAPSLGGIIDLALFLPVAALALYCPFIFVYIWKVQVDLEEIEALQYISEHPEQEEEYQQKLNEKKRK